MINFISEISQLSLFRVDNSFSQRMFDEKLKAFLDDDKFKILVITIDMQELSLEMINHLRMMIEEVHSGHKSSKSVVLLLHFPSSMFSKGIYPTLFLHGWKYGYIDSLSLNQESGDIDIKLWINKCLLENNGADEGLLNVLLEYAKKAIPLLIVDLKSSTCIPESRINSILSIHKSVIIQLICQKFSQYFDPKLCKQYLDEAAQASYKRESSMNIKSHIEEWINDALKIFLKYITIFFHIQGITNIYLSMNTLRNELIQELILYIPVPRLPELKNELAVISKSLIPNCSYSYHCPFFPLLYKEIEQILEKKREEVYSLKSIDKTGNRKNVTKNELFYSVLEGMCSIMQVC